MKEIQDDNVSKEESTTINDSVNQPDDILKPKIYKYKTNSWLYYFLAVFGIFFLAQYFFLGVYLKGIEVVGWSMLPNINASAQSDSDTEHTDIVYYRKNTSYSHNDIVIISNEESQYVSDTKAQFLIKRVIACPNDTIIFFLTDEQVIERGTLLSPNIIRYYYDIVVKNANGNVVEINDEDNRKEDMYFDSNVIYSSSYLNTIYNALKDQSKELAERRYSITISSDCYFVMGDNRNNSADSRYFGEVKYKDIEGNVRLHVKYGSNIIIAIINKIKIAMSGNIIIIKG